MNWKKKIWKITMITFWCLAGVGLVALLVAAVSRKEEERCKGVDIRIHGAGEQLFLDKTDIMELLNTRIEGVPVAELNLQKMEEKLEQHAWIRSTELFIDNNNILRIKVEEREPVARIFTVGGYSFYIDSSCERLPLTEKIAIRLPVFTNFPSDRLKLSKADNELMNQIKEMSMIIARDAFWSAQVAQVDITAQRNFEMIPVVGNHIIEFGDGKDIENKFRRLFVFYQQVMSRYGMSSYERVSVQYAGQIVGKKKERTVSRYDSVLAVKKIQQLIFAAQRMQPDTMRTNMRPLETNTISESQLKNYDMVIDTTKH